MGGQRQAQNAEGVEAEQAYGSEARRTLLGFQKERVCEREVEREQSKVAMGQ